MHGKAKVALGIGRIPDVSEIFAALSDDWKPGPERRVETGRANYDIRIVWFSKFVHASSLRQAGNGRLHQLHVWFLDALLWLSF